ncbi:MAG: hypothetical protein CL857_02640 [Cryomorphaceae bacterium]|nr:hypothetical protein [Cryomorphaceae bacterium]|tara:strand:- start:3499 stop:4425 length:927 start_codon:yes stop_codon:yes gene_type:complete
MNELAQKESAEEEFEELEDSGFELEIVDDTPEEDKGKPRRAEDAEAQLPEDDEIANYSESVQKRIKQLKFEFHEERRRKEEAARIRDEAVNYAKTITEENKKLRKSLEEGEGVLVEQAKGRVDAELERAKLSYKEAYETGDPDKLIDAQEKLSALQNEKFRVESFKPTPSAEQKMPAHLEAKPEVPEPDSRTKEWASKNEWFGSDTEMTGYAFGVHERLVREGVHTSSDEYYQKIDEAMRRTFPDKFDEQQVEAAPVRQTGSVVAPAQRSAKKPRRVQLTSTQVSLAKRLGLTAEQYAAQLLKEASNV